jgi:hypothetical protein
MSFSFSLNIFVFVCLFFFLLLFLFLFLVYIGLSVRLSACLSLNLLVCLSVCPSVCMCIGLSVCISHSRSHFQPFHLYLSHSKRLLRNIKRSILIKIKFPPGNYYQSLHNEAIDIYIVARDVFLRWMNLRLSN